MVFNLAQNIWFVCNLLIMSISFRGGIAKSKAYYGKGSGQIWLDNVRCGGSEKSIFDFIHNGFGNEDRGNDEDADVSCCI